jgi:hypothetical protein
MVDSAFDHASNILEKIENPEEQKPPIDSVGKVSVSPDGMRGYIIMTMPQNGGKPLTLSEIHGLISAAKIVFGVRTLTVNRLGEQPLYDRDVLIAEGAPPIKGKDGSIIYHVKISKDIAPREREDGTVDYKDLGLVENVFKDQLLVEKIMPEDGVDGQTVLGRVINAQKGKEVPLPIGKNTYISENDLFLHAAISGQCDHSDRKLNVMETFTVESDVSTATGNIDFVGNVVVNGDVMTGFSVKAGGNVEVRGCVEGGYITAGGNVLISEGFHGMTKGEIIAGGSVRSKYIQAGRVQAHDFIETEFVMQSEIQTGDTIRLIGHRSIIMGGRVVAKNLIDCNHIGGRNNPIPTVVEVGSDPQLITRSREIQKEEALCVKNISDIERVLQLLRQYDKQNRLTDDKRDLLTRSEHSYRNLQAQAVALKAEAEEVRVKLAEEGYGTIIARIAIYPGVRVVIGPEQKMTSQQLDNCRIARGEDGLIIGPAV